MNRATPWVIALLVSVLANGAMLGLTLHNVSDGPRFDRGHDHRPPAGVRGDGFSVRRRRNAKLRPTVCAKAATT
jgi:hypothetical protein